MFSEWRIILHLSHPKGLSVNDFIPKDIYLGENMPVIYPRVDKLVQMIKEKGGAVYLLRRILEKLSDKLVFVLAVTML